MFINSQGKLFHFDQPIVMGIINTTPDSFFEESRKLNVQEALKQTERMLFEGASIIDIGGMSSRPGAKIIDIEEEKKRVLPIIKSIISAFPNVILSIDTVHAEVAKSAVNEGAMIVNDISAAKIDDEMYAVVSDLNVPYILMHMQGKPTDMQEKPNYKDITLDVLDFFVDEIAKLRNKGVKDIIIDPGFGFGKSIKHNYELLKKVDALKILNVPILVGVSRKSMIYKTLEIEASSALNGTTALHMFALEKGANILRAHDVKEAMECIQLFNELNS